MNLKNTLLLVLLTGLLTTAFTCKSPTESDGGGNNTADTTSHNFIWQMDTIGYRNTLLADGVIINENDMWVVGEIYPDSASYKDAIVYGAAHWNGEKWIPEKVIARVFEDNHEIKLPRALYGVSLVENGKLFASTGLSLMAKENGIWIEKTHLTKIVDPTWSKGLDKIWGNSSTNLYLYGVNGGLYHYNGSSIVLIPTNTDLDIMDMHGDYNPTTKEYELLALASRSLQMGGNLLLKIKGQTVTTLSVNGMNNYSKYNLWFTQGSNYWITGSGVYHKNQLNDSVWERKENFPASNWLTADINGWASNDYFQLQGDGHVLHYNGSTWKDYKQELKLFNVSIAKVFINGNQILMTSGEHNYPNRSIIIRGKKSN